MWDCAQNKVFGDGLFYAADIAGSDIERHPESFSNQLGRHYPECLYQNGTYASSYGLTSYLKENDIYASLYAVVSKANAVITSMENAENFESIINGGQSEMGQMYGEAVAMRATAYRELCKNFGDVPYVGVYGVVPKGLVSRDSIYDVCIEDLQKVEPLMYTIGSIPGIAAANKNYFSKTYVQALIGRMCLDAAGYQTRRGDIKRVNGKGESMTFETKGKENNGATYGRRSDWQDLYSIAKKYYEALLADPGNALFHLTDPRGASDKSGRTFNNPYQYFFEQMHMDDAIYADESIYEYPMQQGGGNDGRPYSFGRPSSGGSKAAYPCKSYGQGRINPAYFYGVFDPNDMRRDVSITMTGSNGKGVEKLIPFVPNSKAEGGGLTLNKWDENRMNPPYTTSQRTSGMNWPVLRLADLILMQAEGKAELGAEGEAIQLLNQIRQRAFGNAEHDISASGEVLKEAILQERKLELLGEGTRRWDLIRSGKFVEKALAVRAEMTEMVNDLQTKGYHEFANGNVISNYIYTKKVHLSSPLTFDPDESNPALYPGWRGQYDYSTTPVKVTGTDHNLAIEGLFNYIDPNGTEAKKLFDEGYSKVDWGVTLVKYADHYTNSNLLPGVKEGNVPPRYYWPIPFETLSKSKGKITNGYGLAQE